jgi:aminopeptidase N
MNNKLTESETMEQQQHHTHKIYRKDYQPPAYTISDVELTFQLAVPITQVTTVLTVQRNDNTPAQSPLVLDGEALRLVSVKLNDDLLDKDAYTQNSQQLIIPNVPAQFTLTIVTEIEPAANTQLSGLYLSNDLFCTQCEAHGFRRITYFIDRPDVMASYTTKIIADKTHCPLLLSNGNLIERQDLPDNKHMVVWQDPFKKPSYLFALVAGDLACLQDTFVTESNREVALNLYVEPGKQDRATHAMSALKRAMAWDEQKFGREYDLDIFNIVAVSHFNMGAMENKSLNIFNDQYILADPTTATDANYQDIERVVAHEYFHNWTGNRITCRDWFQLSLKEGLTVYREQEYLGDRFGHAVNRIQDVQQLRMHQFPEDSSKLAHPVRPESYMEVNNFYTATVYEKGAEVIRMLAVLVGEEGFRRGMDVYFSRYDGQAVTIDDLVQAIAEPNGFDSEQFMLWYAQAGTPKVTVTPLHDATAQQLVLQIEQVCPPTPGQEAKRPQVIPLKMALLDQQGEAYPLQLAAHSDGQLLHGDVLVIDKAQQRVTFDHIPRMPLISLLRDFSAPIELTLHASDEELNQLLLLETNGFAKWEAGQRLASKHLLAQLDDRQQSPTAPDGLLDTYHRLLLDNTIDPQLKAELLRLPTFEALGNQCDIIDVDGLHQVREYFITAQAEHSQEDLLTTYQAIADMPLADHDAAAFGLRSLKNHCLSVLLRTPHKDIIEMCWQQFCQASNMTDELAALHLLVHRQTSYAAQALQQFYDKWRHDELVMHKWFAVQASSPHAQTLQQVQQLLQHPAFTYQNPNRVRALLGTFFMRNPVAFHQTSGEGYIFLSEQLLILDKINPQVTARMAMPLTRFKRYDARRQQFMLTQLQRMAKQAELSNDLREIIQASLAGQ